MLAEERRCAAVGRSAVYRASIVLRGRKMCAEGGAAGRTGGEGVAERRQADGPPADRARGLLHTVLLLLRLRAVGLR